MSVDRDALLASLEEARRDTVALAKSLTPQELALALREGTWTVKDMLVHMTTSEAGLVNTARRIAKGHAHARPGFNIHDFNQQQVEKHRSTEVDALLAELEASRAEMRRALQEMSEVDLAAQGFMSSGSATDVVGVFRRIGEHEREHCRDIREAIGR